MYLLLVLGLLSLAQPLWASANTGQAPPTPGAKLGKTLQVYFPTSEEGFDPAASASAYGVALVETVFERLLTYDYLARPARLVPMTATAMPTVSADGRHYVFHIRPGIHFTPDPAFKGQLRELTAADYVYSFKRFMDPKLRSPWQFLLEGKIEGLDALAQQAARTGRFDYDQPIAGLQATDRYTLEIRLLAPDYNFSYIMAHLAMGALAREVVEAYGSEINAHPVGTGPYMLKEWKRRNRIVLRANPGYRGYIWSFQSNDPADAALIRSMRGKRMPQIDQVIISIIEEPQSIWLAFKGGQLDIVSVPQQFTHEVLDQGRLSAAMQARGYQLQRSSEPDLTYTFFNLRDPVVGGYSKEKIALRRAIAMAYRLDEEIRVIRQGQAVAAQMPIPAGVVGHDPDYRSSIQYDPELANRLLDRYGYRRGADGWRRLPDGQPLLLKIQGDTSGAQRPFDELWKKSLDDIGIRVEFIKSNFSDNLRAARACQVQMMGAAWGADYPDGDNFMQNLYGANIGQSNSACYQSVNFDRIYVQSTKLPDSPERNQLFRQMSRQLEADTAWILHTTRLGTQLTQPWLQGYKKHPILHASWPYLDMSPH